MKTNLKKLMALFLTLAMILPMAVPMLTVSATETDATTTEVASTDDQQEYAYVGNFSESAEEVSGLPAGWAHHPNFKGATITQKDGALYMKAKSVSGLKAIYYNQSDYSDYVVSADFTMVDKLNTTRYMGLTYRMGSNEAGMNMFYVKYNGAAGIDAYYFSAVTGYNGKTYNSGWFSAGGDYSKTTTLTGANKTACSGTVNLKLVCIGDQIRAYVNDVLVFEIVANNVTQEKGSFGIMATQCDIKVENFKVIDLTPNVYAYEDDFSESTEEITGLPAGWVRQKYFKNGTVTQMDGAMYLKAKSVNGLQAAYYEQSVYNDYLVSADFTMVDKLNTSRYMGLTYRMDNNEQANNIFMVTYNGTASFNSYYGAGIEAYDGTKTTAAGWQTAGAPYFKSITLSSVDSSLATAAQGTVNLKLAVVGGTMTGFVNNIKVLEVPIYNKSQALGSFGIMTAQADIKVENFKVIDLTELTQSKTADSIAHTLSLPTAGAADLYLPTSLGNYISSSTLSFDAAAEDTATAEIMIAKNGAMELYATVQKNGAVTLTKATSAGAEILFEGTAEIADTTNIEVKITYANGSAKLTVDGTDMGNAYLLDLVYGRYGFTTDGTASLVDLQLNKTVPHIVSKTFNSTISEIEYNTTPDWSQIELSLKLSVGSVYQPEITADMITGFDPVTPGAQTLTLTYQLSGETYTEKFTVVVKDDPENMPNIKIGVISDVHIGATSSNGPALEKALTYYKNLGVDVIVSVGDMAHNYTKYLEEFDSIYNTVFPDGEDGPEKFFVMGNHDTYCFEDDGYPRGTEAHNDAVEAYFTDTLDCVADYGRAGLNYARIIKGYLFVGLYIQTPIEEREAFLAEVFALPEAQGKPVFIVNHEVAGGSLYSAIDGSSKPNGLGSILTPYPNAVLLTGHAHWPLADERTIWQGEYTSLQSGSLFGPIVEANMYEGGTELHQFQPGNWTAKSALYMEVRNDNINITRYDFTHDEKLGKDWTIPIADGQVDRTVYTYPGRAAAAVAPEFAEDAQVTAEPLSESQIRITFPKAITEYPELDDIITGYVIRAYDDDTNELVAEKRLISQHYLGRNLDKDIYTLIFTGLNSHTNYRFEVTARESFRVEGKPLVVKTDTKAFSTEGLTATFYANFDYEWDAEEFDLYNHNATNPATIADGIIRTNATNASKAIIKDLTFATGTIETMITMNNTAGNISSGIYLFASGAADEQDTITAYNVHLQSNTDSKDLLIALYNFKGKYSGNLESVTLTDYFADGTAKAPVKLKAEVSNGILTVYVDDNAVMTYTVGSMSGGVGLRSHYAGSDFDYIRVHETSTEYVAPDTTELEALFTEAKDLLANTEVEGSDTFTGKNPYVTQDTYDALNSIVKTYDVELIRAYERHVVQVEPILTAGIEQFKQGIEDPTKNWVASVAEQRYESVAEAISAANGQTVKLLASTDEAITVSADVIIDLAGYTLSNVTVADGVTLTLIDTATDDYEGEYGSATIAGTVTTFAEVDGKNYVVVSENGAYSAHCYDVAITHISLNPAKDALGYKTQVSGDEIVQTLVTSLGFNLWVDGGQTKTYEKAASNITLRLQNILKCGGGEMNINATAFVTLAVGEETSTKTSTQQTTTMCKTLQLVDEAWSTYTEAQQTAVKALCDQYYDTICKWGLTNIYPAEQQAEEYKAVSGSFFTGPLNGFGTQNGQLLPAGATGEGKVILAQSVEGDKSVSVDIYPLSGNLINSGIYLGAANAAAAQDSINALAVIVESTVANNPNRVDIVIGNFPTWQEYHRTVFEGDSALFTDGVKQPVNLKVDISGNDLTVTLSLISDPSKSVTVTYTYTGSYDLSTGFLGLRSQYDDSAFDNFKVTNSQQTVEYTFDSDADVTGLEFYHSTWTGGMTATSAQSLALHNTSTFANGTFAADLNTKGNNAAGIVFGADESGESYYLYRLTADRFVELVKVQNGVETVLDRGYLSAGHINTNFNRLEVVKDGNTIYCYYYNRFDKVNCYAVYEDLTPLTGERIGLWSATSGTAFQNVSTSSNVDIRKADVLIFGHSYTEMWWDYETYFPEYESIDDIGIGGSVAVHWEALADEVIAYGPELGIYNIGINDLTGGTTPKAVVDSMESALLTIKEALPEFQVVLVSVSHCPNRSTITDAISETNALMRNLAASYDWMYYAEAEYLFCTDSSNPLSTDASLFIDGLHPSAEGYQLMADVIRSAIKGENQPEFDETLAQAQFETAKSNKLASMGIYSQNAYTAENWSQAQTYYDAAIAKINACTTQEELEALDLSEEIAALNAIPNKSVDVITNILNADTRDALDADSWTKTDDNTVNVSGYSYALDNTTSYSDSEMVFRLTGNTGDVHTGGIFLRATQKDNDGIEGYLVNYVSSGNYMQVYYVNNVYNTDGSSYVLTYLGGIAYGSYGDIIGTEFHVKIEGDKLYLSTLERYQAGEDPLTVVDLTYNGAYGVYESGYIGVLSWNGDVSYDLQLKNFAGE